jgi:hypothetical protein
VAVELTCADSLPVDPLVVVADEPFYAQSDPDPEGHYVLLSDPESDRTDEEEVLRRLREVMEGEGFEVDDYSQGVDWVTAVAENDDGEYFEAGSLSAFLSSPVAGSSAQDTFRTEGGEVVLVCFEK